MISLLKNNIRKRVLLLSIIPMLIITLILGTFFTYTQIRTTRESMIEKGQELSQLLTAAAEFGILSNNPSELIPLSQQLIKNPLIIDVLYMDRDLNIIHRNQSFDISINYPLESIHTFTKYWYFSNPIFHTPIRTDAVSDQNLTPPEIVGWVTIVFSDVPLKHQKNQIITQSLAIIFFGFLITFFIANIFGRQISLPITRLSEIISKLRDGELSIRASNTNTEEFNQLADGINELAQSLEKSNMYMEARITQATQALSISLSELENKNQQLMRAHYKVDSANRAKDAFLARMSHELRTPLTSVIGFTRMIQEGTSELERIHYLKIIDHTSQVLLALIDDVLDFTRLESNALEIEKIEFNIDELFHQALEMQALAAHTKGLEIMLSGTCSVPKKLIGDPTRIRQIITNLISNAIKFTEIGFVHLHVQYCYKLNTLNFSVTDTGVGISNNYKNKMFESFTQADNSISRKYGGSGLGLAIVYRLLKLMDGSIHVNTDSAKGCQFFVELPLALKLNANSNTPQDILTRNANNLLIIDNSQISKNNLIHFFTSMQLNHESINSIDEIKNIFNTYSHIFYNYPAIEENLDKLHNTIETLIKKFSQSIIFIFLPSNLRQNSYLHNRVIFLPKPYSFSQIRNLFIKTDLIKNNYNEIKCIPDLLKILIVEDNNFNRLLIKRMLNQSGFITHDVSNGFKAIEAIQENAYDIILMDINMPDLDGIEASKKILEFNLNSNIIALTANVSSREQQMLNQLGIHKILFKPLNIKDLYAALDSFKSITVIDESNKSDQMLDNHQYGKELEQQLLEVESHINSLNYIGIARNAHQLFGFAGLFDLPEIEVIAEDLKTAVENRNIRDIWIIYNRLKRIKNNYLKTLT